MGRNPTEDFEGSISLPFERDPQTGIHGFFRTREGRSYLHSLFEEFLKRAKIGRGKVAMLIASRSGSPDVQDREADRTKSALRRWHQDRQSELWPKEPERNLEYMERLEIEMMQSDPIEVRLSETAASIRKMQTGTAFARFFYGTDAVARLSEEIIAKRREIEGLLEERKSKFIAADSDWESAGYFADPNFRYTYLRSVPERSFMLMHTFEVDFSGPRNSQITFSALRSGYAYLMADGSVHCLLKSHDDGFSSYDTYVLQRPENVFVNWGVPEDLVVGDWERSSSRLGHGLGFVPFSPGGELGLPGAKELVNWSRPRLLDPRVQEYADRILWHILI